VRTTFALPHKDLLRLGYYRVRFSGPLRFLHFAGLPTKHWNSVQREPSYRVARPQRRLPFLLAKSRSILRVKSLPWPSGLQLNYTPVSVHHSRVKRPRVWYVLSDILRTLLVFLLSRRAPLGQRQVLVLPSRVGCVMSDELGPFFHQQNTSNKGWCLSLLLDNVF
jgi:hypothetical protein